ncbi:purple acid phosphatase family protein [Cohnella nanjingensis]|uniref:Metallophosphoesterase family protein n=1 Tax=Cohnella nanjingensis TaxID=1387779 RepID=A0A7X0VEH3_9BACL|nr:metallophosphoesterase family protein [Cohnella nanjingensis]MBB6669549.1 metallophosphoesterase family protein [Cohnella nanjingensis]
MLTIVKGPYLQRPTTETMTIMWETSEPAAGQVDLWASERIHSGHRGNYKPPERLVSSVRHAEPATIHRLALRGLEPGTLYFYQIYAENAAGERVQSGPHPLKTAVPRGVPFSFTVTSETGGYSGFDVTDGRINRNIFRRMGQYRPDIALFVGDLVNDGHRYEDWETYFFGPGKEFLRSTPFYSCLGNHEDHAEWYDAFMDFPSPRSYYSFDYGDVHFTCLDSTEWIPSASYPHSAGEIRPGNAQFDFLVRDLEAYDARWKVVFFHYPPYVSGGYQVEDLRQICPLLERYGVDLVINSHTIVYERSHPLRSGQVDEEGGIVYLVAGGAGAMPEWLLPKREWHTSQSLAVPHFLQVTATSSRLEIRAIDEEGRLFDSFRIRKGNDGKKTYD